VSTCAVCKAAAATERTVRVSLDYEGRMYIFDNVPAEVCGQCGEVLLRPNVAKQLETLMRTGAAPERTESVPVYDLAAVA
jgi:HTH-type transcriptional regulator/antitoxin MqsA